MWIARISATAVRDMISLQDEVNKRRSKALHLMSVRQTYGNQQAISDVDKAKRQLSRADGHVEVNAGGKFGEDFGILPTGDMAASQMQLMQHATAELQASGPNAAMAGGSAYPVGPRDSGAAGRRCDRGRADHR